MPLIALNIEKKNQDGKTKMPLQDNFGFFFPLNGMFVILVHNKKIKLQ